MAACVHVAGRRDMSSEVVNLSSSDRRIYNLHVLRNNVQILTAAVSCCIITILTEAAVCTEH